MQDGSYTALQRVVDQCNQSNATLEDGFARSDQQRRWIFFALPSPLVPLVSLLLSHVYRHVRSPSLRCVRDDQVCSQV